MIGNQYFSIRFRASAACLWEYGIRPSGGAFQVAPPIFELDGAEYLAELQDVSLSGEPQIVFRGVKECAFEGRFIGDPALRLKVTFRFSEDSPVVRFRYTLLSEEPRTLTKTNDHDRLRYFGICLADMPTCAEVRLSEFDESVHSFRPTERPISQREFDHELLLMGPILTARAEDRALLVAYEHGSQAPDAFVHYALTPDRRIELEAVKGNYHADQPLDRMHSFETIWFQLAAVAGDLDALASAYRSFVLRGLSPNVESRKPYIFYNTWNYQERNKWWNGKTFLASMRQDRILKEIDVAHAMGIEVFVIDTGWYEKTGDWRVNRSRFSDGLKAVKARLDGYGMKLGLWFSPREAAVTSRMLLDHTDCLMAWDGKVREPHPVWETEESQDLCLVSRYWQAFADELIRLNREVGVTYFKWDAVHQYGCNAPGHYHGSEANTAAERADCYAFELPRYMTRVVDRVCAACPDAIVDFDITEGQRAVGLGFLAAGKYFLINNGPYYQSLDDPQYAPGGGMGANVFVFPGSARARVCRAPLGYDLWIPSVLFLTHYLPDDPQSSQMVNLASLVLGQNGIWGDLLAVSPEGVDLFDEVLGLYKQVREDVTAADPVVAGVVGGSPEVHEKVNAATGRGVVSIFAGAPGAYTYVTSHPVTAPYWTSDGISVALDGEGRARLDMVFDEHGAKLVFFGVD